MENSSISSDEARHIREEVQALRREFLLLHEETHGAIANIRNLIEEFHRIETTEAAIERELGTVAQRMDRAFDDQQPSLNTCESCGSKVERHEAENGVLLICKACGHTAFANQRNIPDRRAISDRRRQGQSATEGAQNLPSDSFDWTHSQGS